MESELTAAILGALIAGVVSPIMLEYFQEWRRERNWAAPRKKLLKELLERKEFRTLETLTRVSGTTPDKCRTLLIELGARGALLKSGKEGWTLKDIGSAKPEDFDNED